MRGRYRELTKGDINTLITRDGDMSNILRPTPNGFAATLVAYSAFLWPMLTVGILAASLSFMSPAMPAVSTVVLASGFVVMAYLAVTDIKARVIPNKVVLPATWAAIMLSPWSTNLHDTGYVYPVLMSSLGWLFCVVWMGLAAYLSEGRLAGGDIKLAGLIGAMTGMPFAPAALSVGVLMGGIFACWLIVSKRRSVRDVMPYAPGLCGSCCLVLLYLWIRGMSG